MSNHNIILHFPSAKNKPTHTPPRTKERGRERVKNSKMDTKKLQILKDGSCIVLKQDHFTDMTTKLPLQEKKNTVDYTQRKH